MGGQVYSDGFAFSVRLQKQIVDDVISVSLSEWETLITLSAETGTADQLDIIRLDQEVHAGDSFAQVIMLIAASGHTINVTDGGNIHLSQSPLAINDTSPLLLINMGAAGFLDFFALLGGVVAAGVTMELTGTPTYSSVQDMHNIFHSTGWVSGGLITDVGGEQITVDLGVAFVRDTNDSLDTLRFADFPNLTATSIPTDTTRYIGVQFVASVMSIVIKTSYTWDFNTDFPLGSIVNEAGVLHVSNVPFVVGDHASLMVRRALELQPKAIPTNNAPILADLPAQYITVTDSAVWLGLVRLVLDSINTSGADTYESYYITTGTWTRTGSLSIWPNTQYNNPATGLVSLTNNRYMNLWFYLDYEAGGSLLMVYGQAEYVSVELAAAESPPTSLPDRIVEQGIFIAQMIIQEGVTSAVVTLNPFEDDINLGVTTSHSSLSGLAVGDDHPQYQLVTGRANEQQVWPDSVSTPQWKLTPRAAAPTDTPVLGDMYMDDGTNTDSGKVDVRVYNGSAWIDLGANADNFGKLELVEEKIFVSAATTTTFTGLSGTDRYVLESRIVNDAGSNVFYSVRINGDANDNDYFYIELFAQGVGPQDAKAVNNATLFFCYPNDEGLSVVDITLVDGRYHGFSRGSAWNAADTGLLFLFSAWKNTDGVGSISQISVVSSVANGIGVDTILRLYKVII